MDVRWAAGFLDGEGCIQVRSRKTVRRRSYYLTLYAGQVDPRPLYALMDLFGGSVVRRTNASALARGRRKMFMWRITGRTCESALRQLLPYFIVKKRQAELALEFQDRLGIAPHHGRKLMSGEHEIRERLIAEIKAEKWQSFDDFDERMAGEAEAPPATA